MERGPIKGCVEAEPLPANFVKERLLWLDRCVWVVLVEWRVTEERVMQMLAGGARKVGWAISMVLQRGFLAISPSAEASVSAGFLPTDGVLLWVARWSTWKD